MEKSNDSSLKNRDAGRLQQMSEEMKLHIAQLKAELGTAEATQQNAGMQETLDRRAKNKAVATMLRHKMELEKRKEIAAEQSEASMASSGVGCGILLKKDSRESLIDVASEDNVYSTAYTLMDSHRRRHNSDGVGDVIEPHTRTRAFSGGGKMADRGSFPDEFKLNFPSSTRNPLDKAKTRNTPDVPYKNMAATDDPSHDQERSSNLDADQEAFFTPLEVPSKKNAKILLPSKNQTTLPSGRNKTRLKSSNGSLKKGRSKSRHKDSISSTDTSFSTPRSFTEPTEDSIPVKYLQMTNTSPTLVKKAHSASRIKNKSSSVPSSARGSKSDTALVRVHALDEEEKQKHDQLEAQFFKLQLQCEQLAEENIKMKREERSKAIEKISTLKKSNGELASIARRLEEKARSLQEQNTKKTQELASTTRELQQQKRAHQRSKARWESEQSRSLTERNDEITTVKNQVEDLKRALRQVRREKMVQATDGDSGDELTIFKQNQKEMLHLQKLAAAASSKVVVRSLSTPVTARQKILEESNRNLRRQLAAAEASLQEAEAKESSTDHLSHTLTSLQEENKELKKEIQNHKASIATLQSVLQESKVETSDVSVQLTDLKHIHTQLQDDYATVHEQLSVAIQERDTAANKCMQHNDRINEMETLIKKLKEREEANHHPQEEMNNMISSHEKIVAEYQDALTTLQSKVTQLERQCQDQTTTNKTMKDQLSRLVHWSKNNPTQDGGQRVDNRTRPEDNSNNNNIEGSSRVFNDRSPISSPGSLSRKSLPGRRSRPVSDHRGALSGSKERQLFHKSHEEEDVDSDDTEAEDFDDEMEPRDDAVVPVNGPSPSVASVLKLYIAKYTYKPDQGPNALPELELPLVAGDYLYVCGDMDEDGFYEGELMDGRRGLVPSNFIEPLHEPPANDNSPRTRMAIKSFAPGDNPHQHGVTEMPDSLRRSADLDLDHSMLSSASAGSLDSHRLLPSNADSRPMGVLPYPYKLRVDKKLSHTLIIGWLPPGLHDDEVVEEYHILVDGRLATVVDGNKCKAVVENIYHDKKSYVISVCCVTKHGRSDPGHCVITHGNTRNDATKQVVSHVEIEYVSTDSARVSWKSTNSNFPNKISIGVVNDETAASDKLRHYQRQILVPPPMYRHTINGLKPNTVYELVVRTREGKHSEEAVSTPIRFVTPLLGPPDPPLGVEVEENPSNKSIVVSWIPVSLNERGISNGEVVRGYSIYINNILFSSVEPSSCDECIVSMKGLASSVRKIVDEDFSCRDPSFGFTHGLPSIKITVRTLAESGNLSDSSSPFQLNKSLVTRMLHTAGDREGAGDEKTDHVDEDRSLRRSQLDESDRSDGGSNSSGLNLNDPSASVPSIEITLDTSSEDEAHSFPVVHNRTRPMSGSRHPPSPANKQRGSPKPKRSMNDPVAKLKLEEHNKGIKSRSWGYSDHHPADRHKMKSSIPQIDLHRMAQSDEESGTSASSGGHTSTSTSGSVGRKRRSASQKQLKMHQSWTDAGDARSEVGYVPSMVKSSTPKGQDHHHAHNVGRSPDGRRNVVARQQRASHTTTSQSERESASELDSVDESRVSLFVALYDYNPQTMSPNVDNCDDELSFKEGQLIKVYGEKGSDGFYVGENARGTRGYIPSNMVSYVEVDDYTMLEDLLDQGHLPPESPLLHPANSPLLKESEVFQDSHGPVLESDSTKPSVYRALYDYDPKEASPNIDAEVELSFARGDLVNIFGDVDEDGFFRGEILGQFGLVPSNFVEPITEDQLTASQVRKVSATTMTETTSIARKSDKPTDPASFTSTTTSASNSSSTKGDGARKKGIFSKGKKLLKKLGNNETRRR